ncbi:MAG: D-sedoheptulose 7-phosphate isomerase [Crocinitomicaceae bacterium]
MEIKQIADQFFESQKVLTEFIENQDNMNKILKAANIIAESISKGGKVISCGNGGSMCDAMHFAEELTGRYRDDRSSIPAISISDPSHITCVGNDYGFDYIFSRYLEGVGKQGDVLLGISTSGNSKNVVEAVKVAQKLGMKTITLTGKDGGKLANMADVEIRAPHSKYADRAQEIHIKVIHTIIGLVENKVK